MEYTRPPVVAVPGRVIISVIGLVVLAVGLHSYSQSTWTKKMYFPDLPGTPVMRMYEFCQVEQFQELKKINVDCPSILLEDYFISVIIIGFIMSLASLFIALKKDAIYSKLVDAGYHLIATILVILAGILYIISATQISKLVDAMEFKSYDVKARFLKEEKIAVGAMTIIWGVSHFAVGGLIKIPLHRLWLYW